MPQAVHARRDELDESPFVALRRIVLHALITHASQGVGLEHDGGARPAAARALLLSRLRHRDRAASASDLGGRAAPIARRAERSPPGT
jgi:hypothetical protein